MLDVPAPWPRPGVLEAFVEKSSGYFIYAATVVAFVDDEFADPSERVEVLQTLKPVPLGDTPFMALDQLYTQILTAVPRRLHAKLRDVLCVIVNFGFDLSATAIGALLNLGDVAVTSSLLVDRNVGRSAVIWGVRVKQKVGEQVPKCRVRVE
ncbi:hypothetical protein B0H13DRAFT_2309785 [Mycena leptocephala]|nr:hypothetical protein B0H13DRAFT_2309785 [Mycena leptocephala]